jgi:Zn-dependent protease
MMRIEGGFCAEGSADIGGMGLTTAVAPRPNGFFRLDDSLVNRLVPSFRQPPGGAHHICAVRVAAGWLGASNGGATGVVSSVSTVILMFGIVVLHELGHAFAASRYGIRASRILLCRSGHGGVRLDSPRAAPG